ncbi:MAG: hypothetical protein ACRC3H_07905 [Lachnospiraceae bacterium]
MRNDTLRPAASSLSKGQFGVCGQDALSMTSKKKTTAINGTEHIHRRI